MTVCLQVWPGPVRGRVGRANIQVMAAAGDHLDESGTARRWTVTTTSKLRFPPLRIILITLRHGSHDKLTEYFRPAVQACLRWWAGPHEAAEPGRTKERPNRICEA